MDAIATQELLTDFDRDALREVATIGAGHVATALSQLAGAKVLIEVPQVSIVHISEVSKLIGPQAEPMAGMYMRLMGDGNGTILVALRRQAALSLVDLLLANLGRPAHLLSEMEQSALREVGNILAGAFLTAIGNFVNVVLLPSVPHLAVDMIGALVQSLLIESGIDRDYAFVMHVSFLWGDHDVGGHLLIAPDATTMDALLRRLRELSQDVC